MTSSTVYLVTGANRGIGHGLAAALLLRPQSTVIATIRSATTDSSALTSLPRGEGSVLVVAQLDISESPAAIEASARELYRTLTAEHGIACIDTVIASAGLGASFQSSLATPLAAVVDHFHTNTLGPLALFHALYPLLDAREGGEAAKFVLVSSSLGSIGDMEGRTPSLAYGVSKAGANYFVRKVHFECPGITAFAIHPGWVKTQNGQAFADSVGVSEPPMTLDESVKGVLAQIDGATKTVTSGTFVSYDGTTIKW